MSSSWNFLYSLRNPRIFSILAILVVIAAIPLTVLISQRQQNLEQKAYLFSCSVITMAVENKPHSQKAIVSKDKRKPEMYNAISWYLDPGSDYEQTRVTSENSTIFENLTPGEHKVKAEYIISNLTVDCGTSLPFTIVLRQSNLVVLF